MDSSSAVRQGDWFVLFDPNWCGDPTLEAPPTKVIVGGWRVEPDGIPGPFQPNPGYLPRTPHTPSDPIDALIRLIAKGEDHSGRIVPTLTNSIVEIGCDEQNRPEIALSPDNRPCVVVVTAEIHKQCLPVRRWLPVLGSRLPIMIPDATDILLNPGHTHQFRLSIAAIRAVDRA